MTEYVKNLGTGWNLGNTLDARPKDVSNPNSETGWFNPPTTEAMIKKVKDAGFDILRVPVTWCWRMSEDYTVNKQWMDRVNEVVDYGINNEMTVILNIHHENWHFPSEENYPNARKILIKLWEQIAARFENYGQNLIFESMNEPRKVKTPLEWTGGDEEGRQVVMKLNQDFVDTIRKTGGNNPTRMLLVPNYAASCEEIAMQDFKLPKGDNLILSLHGYIPYDFALSDDHSKNPFHPEGRQAIDDLFKRIDKYFTSKGIPVIMGECGARRKHSNEKSRAEWAKYYTAKAKEQGIPCIWWDNGYLEGDEKREVFGLLDRNAVEWGFPEIVENFLSHKV